MYSWVVSAKGDDGQVLVSRLGLIVMGVVNGKTPSSKHSGWRFVVQRVRTDFFPSVYPETYTKVADLQT
jgi:hypothetical protein